MTRQSIFYKKFKISIELLDSGVVCVVTGHPRLLPDSDIELCHSFCSVQVEEFFRGYIS